MIVTTRTILHPCLDVMKVTEVKQIHKSVWNRNQSHKAIQGYPICLTDSDHDFILDEIKCRDKHKYDKYISIDNKEYWFTRCYFLTCCVLKIYITEDILFLGSDV